MKVCAALSSQFVAAVRIKENNCLRSCTRAVWAFEQGEQTKGWREADRKKLVDRGRVGGARCLRSCHRTWLRKGDFFIAFLAVWKLGEGGGGRGRVKESQRREACLLVCVIVLTWLAVKEKRFLYLAPRRWEIGSGGGGGGGEVLAEKERWCWSRGERDGGGMKKSKTVRALPRMCVCAYEVCKEAEW